MSNNLRIAIGNLRAAILERGRRVAERHDVYDGALTFIQGHPEAISCVMKNLSDSGTRILLVGETCVLPKHFRMHILEKQLMAHCEQVWQKGDEVGLKFNGLANIG